MKTSCCSVPSSRPAHSARAFTRPLAASLRLRLLVAANRLRRRFHPLRSPVRTTHVSAYLS